MPTMSLVALFVELLVILTTFNISLCNGSFYVGCIGSERKALLRFKQDLIDPTNRLASWSSDGDCCKWSGVVCDNLTGHVLELNLRNPALKDDASDAEYETYEMSKLSGKINPSLLYFKHLLSLDLSDNNFEGIPIPIFLGSMRNLRYLNLSSNGFQGMIPHQLGNLSNLQYLDFGRNFDLHVKYFWWLSGLSQLEYLDLTSVDLSEVSDHWLMVINKLPSLAVLQLPYCQLDKFPPISVANFSSLIKLDLSANRFEDSSVPSWIFNLGNLVFLNLRRNRFQGPIPIELQNLTSLEHLDLSVNLFNSSIPDWLYRFGRLEYLALRANMLQGTLSTAIGNLTSMNSLDLSLNRLEGRIPRSLGRLCSLSSIYLTSVRLSQEISEILDILSACVSDRLESLDLSYNQLSGQLTNQLGYFKSLNHLSLQQNFIFGPIPSSLGELSSLETIDISYNKFNGTLCQIHFTNLTRLRWFVANENSLVLKVSPDWVPSFQLEDLMLGSCHVGLQFPSWVRSQKILWSLDLSNAGISDKIPSWFWDSLHQFEYLNLSHNQIQGEIPNLSEVTGLEFLDLSSNEFSGPLPIVSSNVIQLDLSNNNFSGSIFQFLCYGKNESMKTRVLNLRYNLLSGELPDCWMNWQSLSALNLDNNNFTGSLPISMGTLNSLKSLHLRKNSLSGTVPVSLQYCINLRVLDLGENGFVGDLSTWIGESFSSMTVLNLRLNRFHGLLPTELCHLVFLQVLDLGYNNISGPIPRCISNFSALVIVNFSEVPNRIIYSDIPPNQFVEDTSVVVKGNMLPYHTTLNLVRLIDLSHNSFSGEIPVEVTNLGALQTLNLSYNSLTGRIPENIGAMRSLESLDFSSNHLSGEIPQSISNLTFLSRLNLSNNNLIGKIPSSTQLQSADASSFTGNELCGPPLPQNCTTIVPIPDRENGDDNEHEVNWFYVSMALGFVVGFWSFIGPLLLNRRWRFIYCHFLNCLGNKFGVVIRKCS